LQIYDFKRTNHFGAGKVVKMKERTFIGWLFQFLFSRRAILTLVMLISSPALAQFPGLPGCSQEFYRDVMSAEAMVNQSKSIEPLIVLQQRYTNLPEQTSLEISIGLDYNQRTGVVNPSNAVVHFTAALKNDLPEQTFIEILTWRGGSQEQLKNTNEALEDYLRGLLACSYYDLSDGWPEIQQPKVLIYINSSDPKNSQRARDYNLYRKHVDLQRFLLMHRYYFIDSAKRVRQGKSDPDIRDILQTISPDSSGNEKIVESLKSDNK
jgi:hypothetical protein